MIDTNMINDIRLKMEMLLLKDNSDLLKLITKYDCKPSEIAEIVRLKPYDPTIDCRIIDIKLKPKKKSIFDKVKKLCRIE